MKQGLKATLFFLFAAVSIAACSAGNATSPMPGTGAAFGVPDMAAAAVAPVALRSARYFAVLAGSTVTSSGPTHVNGDLGVSPGTATSGFPPGVLHGRMRAGGPIAKQAEMDVTTAFNDAMSRVHNPITVSGNLGGQSLAPGLYKSTSSLAVSSGDLTLNGHGNSNSVFLFQMASTFTMTAGRRVILTNGAKARNVFWIVGSSATFTTGCSFYGNLLASKSISMGTGTTVVGRLLARSGAVTMESNTIDRPAL